MFKLTQEKAASVAEVLKNGFKIYGIFKNPVSNYSLIRGEKKSVSVGQKFSKRN